MQEVYKIDKSVITLGKYININTQIEFKCSCGENFFKTPKLILRDKSCRCSKCSIDAVKLKLRKSKESFDSEFNETAGDEYTLLENYLNSNTNIKIRHNVCGFVFSPKPSNFINKGSRCPKCSNSYNIKLTDAEFRSRVETEVGEEYEVCESYIDSKTPINIKHMICNFIFKPNPHNFLGGSRCPNCYGNIKKTTQEFTQEIYSLVGKEYEVLGEYNGNKTKIKMRHNKCGTVYSPLPNGFLRGSRCPKCKESKGENIISSLLSTLHLKFKPEKKFEKCISEKRRGLPFDFFIENEILIEYDGEYHFRKGRFKNHDNEDRYKKGVSRDKIKNQYCISNNIPLIRIPYWEFNNIESILENTLIHFGLMESNPNYDNKKVLEYLVDENWNHDEYIAKCPKNIKEREQSDSIAI